MGCSVVSLFVTKYPQYADAICLLAPPRMSILQSLSFLLFCFFIQIACKEYESEIIEEVRKGHWEIVAIIIWPISEAFSWICY